MGKIKDLMRRANFAHDAISREIILHEIDRLAADQLHVLEGEARSALELFASAIRVLARAL